MPRHTRIRGYGQKGNKTRGRHKRHSSPETRLWNKLMKKKKAVTQP